MVICTSLMGHASVRPSVGVQSVKASDGATGKFVRCVCWGFQQLHGMPIGQLSWHVVTKYWPSLSWWAASRQATLLLPTKAMLLVVSMQARTALSTSQELSATLVQCDEMHTHAEQFLNVDMIPAWVSNQWSLRLLSMLRPDLRLRQDSQHTSAQYRVVMHDAMSYLSNCRAQQLYHEGIQIHAVMFLKAFGRSCWGFCQPEARARPLEVAGRVQSLSRWQVTTRK